MISPQNHQFHHYSILQSKQKSLQKNAQIIFSIQTTINIYWNIYLFLQITASIFAFCTTYWHSKLEDRTFSAHSGWTVRMESSPFDLCLNSNPVRYSLCCWCPRTVLDHWAIRPQFSLGWSILLKGLRGEIFSSWCGMPENWLLVWISLNKEHDCFCSRMYAFLRWLKAFFSIILFYIGRWGDHSPIMFEFFGRFTNQTFSLPLCFQNNLLDIRLNRTTPHSP